MYVYTSDVTRDSLTLYIKDLEYAEHEYDSIEIMLNGLSKEVMNLDSTEYHSGSVTFNGLSPSTLYDVKGFVKFAGKWTEVAGATFITSDGTSNIQRPKIEGNFGMSIAPPPVINSEPKAKSMSISPMAATPTEYYPTFYPRVQEQWIWGNGDWYMEGDTCVPATLTCAKEIQHYRRTEKQVYFTNWWIYGNRASYHHQSEGMFPYEAMEKLQADGVTEGGALIGYNSNLPYNDFSHLGSYLNGAKSRVQNEYSSKIATARENRLASWSEYLVNVASIDTIKNSIIQNGVAIVWFNLYAEFYTTSSSGIVAPFTSSNGYSHTMPIIGWKNINGVPHWICQNSWWSNWGDGGRCYMAFNNRSIYAYYTMQDNTQLPSGITGLTNFSEKTYIYLSWSETRNTKEYRINYRERGSSTWIDAGSSLYSYKYVTNLKQFTAYEIKIYANNSYGNGPATELLGVNAITTLGDPTPAPTNFRVYDRSSTSISSAWNTVSVATGYSLEVYHAATNELKWSSYNFTGTSATSTGLISGVTYNLKLWAIRNGVNSTPVWLNGVKAGNTRPSNWTLFTNYSNGQTASISASTWNDFIVRIKDFFIYKDLNPNTYTFTSAISGTPITATQINQARNAIAHLGPTTSVPSSVGTGNNANVETVKGLQYSLNSVA